MGRVPWPALGLGGTVAQQRNSANVCSEGAPVKLVLVVVVSERSPDTGFKIQARLSFILLQGLAVNVSVAVQAQVKLVKVM